MAEPAPLNVAFVWHMHQPYYRDPMTGEHMLPWVLLHGTKDYLHMASVLEQFPKLHMTFNLVPCLVQQVIEYANEEATSRFLRVCRTAPDRLSDDEKSYILSACVSINYDN